MSRGQLLAAGLTLGIAAAFAAAVRAGQAGARAAPASASGRVDAFWARATQEVYKTPEELAAQAARERRKGMVYDKLARGNPRDSVVALTFDDGPHPQFTPQLLDILKRYQVKATFFVVGKMAKQSPDLVRAEAAAGHLLGNHTYHHVNLTRVPDDEIPVEWQACQDVVKAITGQTMRFCRPPGGDYDDVVIRDAMQLGLTTVLWTDDPGDYASPGDRVIRRRVLNRIGNGGIILLHDGVQQTLDVLPQIIEHLKREGYQFATVAELQQRVRGRRPGRQEQASMH
jgi:peptidoglycan/xylan/chitin deacetylase (PgdA/CDA1 family)